MAANEKALLPVYLIVGDDQLKREYMSARLVKRVAALGDIEFNSATFTPQNTAAPEAIVDACNTAPFCSDIRLVLVKELDKFNKATHDALTAYIENPSATTVLALEAEKLAKNTRLYKAVAKVGAKALIDCTAEKKSELPTLVRSMANAYRVAITQAAAVRLVELVGTSTVALDSELAKLASYVRARGAGEISPRDVDALVTRTAEVKPWELSDALAARDTVRCLTLIARMPEQSPHALLAICLVRLRELITARALVRRPGAPTLAAYLGVPDWRVRNHTRWAEGFTAKELVVALRNAADVEQKMKSGGDAHLLFEQWVTCVCRGSLS